MDKMHPSLSDYTRLLREHGAVWAAAVKASSVVTAPWVRMKCRYGCDCFDQRHMCPPRTPTAEETGAVVQCYSRALLALWDSPPGLKERRAMRAKMHREMLALERRVFLDGFYKALAFVAGPCRLCAVCDVSKPCQRQGEPRPSMEACGMDVFATFANAGHPIDVITRPDQHHKLCGLLLVD